MKLYETYDYKGQGYQKLFHFKSWRIAELKYIQEIDASPVNFLECHLESDEVFILLEGDCNMWLFTDNKPDSSFEFITLNKNEIYRIPQGIYHAHRLSKDAKILIIEEDSTNDKNSHRIYLNEIQIEKARR